MLSAKQRKHSINHLYYGILSNISISRGKWWFVCKSIKRGVKRCNISPFKKTKSQDHMVVELTFSSVSIWVVGGECIHKCRGIKSLR